MFKKYFSNAVYFSIFAVLLSGAIGYAYGGWPTAIAYMFSAGLLGVLETCVSFDNAIVNATVLQHMDDTWQHRFLTWGMVVAVFGMRLLFPILIVSVATHVWPWHAVQIALFKPDEYMAAITSSHTQIMGFGGTFLMMVFLKFFLDAEKEHHWIAFIEKRLVAIGKIESVQAAVAIVTLLLVTPFIPESEKFFTAGLLGIVGYILVDGIGAFLGDDGAAAKTGLSAFIYLEVVDASFSFDGVIAAFAITNNFLIIALGLGIGAMWVRDMTIYMVKQKTLEALAYLEHGAFWAIGFLVVVMYLAAAHIELGEIATAGGSLAIIAVAFFHSLAVRKADNSHDPVAQVATAEKCPFQ
jgi:hypothetical protein